MIKIAIDGPSGAGKSTLAKNIAAALDYMYLDTGALYRTIGLYIWQNNIELTDSLDPRSLKRPFALSSPGNMQDLPLMYFSLFPVCLLY